MDLSPASPDVRPVSALLKALADDNRLRILALLSGGERCVCHVAERLALTQPNASQHLSVLRRAGLVEGERRGGWTWYRLTAQEPARARIIDAVLAGLPELEPDLNACTPEQTCGPRARS